MSLCDKCIHVGVCRCISYGESDEVEDCRHYEGERPCGEWIHGQGSYGFPVRKCSNCGGYGNPLWHYCPNCGMRVKNELNRVNKELNSEIEKSKSEIVPDYRGGWRLREGERK